MMAGPRPAESVRLSDDELGSLAVALVVGELQWTPDVAPLVMDRISRDAVAYPDHFDRRSGAPASGPDLPVETPSIGRTLRRVVIFASIALLVAVLVLVAATANAADASSGGADAFARILSFVTEVS